MKLGSRKVAELDFRLLRLKLAIYNMGRALMERLHNKAGNF